MRNIRIIHLDLRQPMPAQGIDQFYISKCRSAIICNTECVSQHSTFLRIIQRSFIYTFFDCDLAGLHDLCRNFTCNRFQGISVGIRCICQNRIRNFPCIYIRLGNFICCLTGDRLAGGKALRFTARFGR